MIRSLLLVQDIERVMEIWQQSTIEAHSFISKDYWESNYEIVKQNYIPISETYVFDSDDGIKGFISILNDSFIGALFVDTKCQGRGVGKALIEFAKKRYKELTLAVYRENKKAVEFYKNAGFTIESEQINEDTEKYEYIMNWKYEK